MPRHSRSSSSSSRRSHRRRSHRPHFQQNRPDSERTSYFIDINHVMETMVRSLTQQQVQPPPSYQPPIPYQPLPYPIQYHPEHRSSRRRYSSSSSDRSRRHYRHNSRRSSPRAQRRDSDPRRGRSTHHNNNSSHRIQSVSSTSSSSAPTSIQVHPPPTANRRPSNPVSSRIVRLTPSVSPSLSQQISEHDEEDDLPPRRQVGRQEQRSPPVPASRSAPSQAQALQVPTTSNRWTNREVNPRTSYDAQPAQPQSAATSSARRNPERASSSWENVHDAVVTVGDTRVTLDELREVYLEQNPHHRRIDPSEPWARTHAEPPPHVANRLVQQPSETREIRMARIFRSLLLNNVDLSLGYFYYEGIRYRITDGLQIMTLASPRSNLTQEQKKHWDDCKEYRANQSRVSGFAPPILGCIYDPTYMTWRG